MKEELELRQLETNGPKSALLERLQKTPKVKKVMSPVKVAVGNVRVKEEPVETDNPEDENGFQQADEDHLVDEVGTVDDECVIIEDEEYYANGDEENEILEENEIDENENVEETPGDSNNPDNEESINLTIGEEEQQLLHDEASDEKEKSATVERGKTRKEGEETGAGKKIENQIKDESKAEKEEGSKNKCKGAEISGPKKENSSEQKSTSKTSQKEDKEKSSAASANTSTTNTAGDAAKSAASSKSTSPSRNLWVSGLSSLTRASDLKTIFSNYGKVIGAKVVTNTRTPGTRCYGYVTMSSATDATRCIENLHRTELHGRIISVERTKNEIGGNASSANAGNRAANNSSSKTSRKGDDEKRSSGVKTSSGDDKKKGDDKRTSTHGSRKDDKTKRSEKDKDKSDDKADSKDPRKDKARSEVPSVKRPSRRVTRSAERNMRKDRSRDHDREREHRQRERERERERIRQREILSYQKIREERERQRLREKERELREEERRRREIRDRQRQEEQRLAEERKKLALERERLEREKAELLRLERERQKLEREKIELERLELKRQQMKIIQSRDDPVKRPAKRSGDERYTDVPDRKRSTAAEGRFEAPPPPRFDAALVSSRSYEKKREDYSTSSSTKRAIDDYSTSKRTDYSSKRDDYSSASTKRAAVDDYPPVPSKRSSDDYSKRSAGDYISTSTKRSIDDYSSSNKRDDYSSSKPPRDDYKREVEIRHIPTSNNSGGSSSYIHKSTGNRYGDGDIQVRSTVTAFRRVDDRGDVRSATSGKRYEGSSGYGSNSNNVWTPASSSHMGHSNSGGVPTLKSYVSNGMSSNVHSSSAVWQKSSVGDPNWRSLTSSQDRYDRTYNERSGGYVDSSRSSGIYSSSGRAASDRYGGTLSSRYEGKY